METWSVVVAVLAAVLTGALLPLVFQLRATLRSVQVTLDGAAPKLNLTLDELLLTTREARLAVGTINENRPQLQSFVDAAVSLTETMTQLQASVRTASTIGAAVGPAVVAAFHAFRAIRAEDAVNSRSEPSGADESPAALPPSEEYHEQQ